MELLTWIKKHGLTTLLIGAMIGAYTFFIEARYMLKDHEDTLKELRDDVKNMPKRILDEVRARQRLQELQNEGIKRDSTDMIIKIN